MHRKAVRSVPLPCEGFRGATFSTWPLHGALTRGSCTLVKAIHRATRDETGARAVDRWPSFAAAARCVRYIAQSRLFCAIGEALPRNVTHGVEKDDVDAAWGMAWVQLAAQAPRTPWELVDPAPTVEEKARLAYFARLFRARHAVPQEIPGAGPGAFHNAKHHIHGNGVRPVRKF
jgi:hypothetical protein